MTIIEDNLMISDKLWILVGMLLRNGHSCTPAQLSDRCHLIRFTSSEIELLCKLPFSPLSLSECGQVTFSHFVFQFFDGAKESYATPSMPFVLQDRSLNKPNQKVPLYFSQMLRLPGPSDEFSPCNSSGDQHLLSHFELSLSHPQASSGKGQPLPINIGTRHYVRKRRTVDTLLPPGKKQNISHDTTYWHAIEVKEVDLTGSAVMPSAVLCSATETEAKESCAISLRSTTERVFEFPAELKTKQNAIALTKGESCYSQQTCLATCPIDIKTVIEQNVSIESVPNRQNAMHTIDKGGGEDVCAVIDQKWCLDLPTKLDTRSLVYYGYAPKETDDETCTEKSQENLQAAVAEIRLDAVSTSLVELIEQYQDGDRLCAGSFPCIGPMNADKLPEDQIEATAASVLDITRKEASAACSSKLHDRMDMEVEATDNFNECNVSDASGAGDANRADPPAFKLAKRGKTLKGSWQKKENGKQVTRLPKHKKACGTRNKAALAACSMVVETCSNQPVEVNFPSFEGFAVESVEGSGGYAKVYKAVRKVDGKLLAIKYPSEKTSAKHVQNEIKVLQKYGGQNCIPQCLGVIEESGRQCLVLEYIEHEKPEVSGRLQVLKKEISISELQFYGFSLFKALEYLHGKGIIHRDVKPGNFLFSRNQQCGWLIDFNLTTAQLKQPSSGSKSRKHAGERIDRCKHECKNHQTTETSPEQASTPSVREHQSMTTRYSRKTGIKHLEPGQLTSTPSGTPCDAKLCSQGTYSTLSQAENVVEATPSHHRRKLRMPESGLDVAVHAFPKFSAARTSPATGRAHSIKETTTLLKGPRSHLNMLWSPLKEQGRIPRSGDTHGDQVLPRFGRRELWEFVQKSQQSPQPPVASLCSSHKKRVAAPQNRKHQKSLLDQGLPQSSTLPVSNLSCIKAPNMAHLPKARGIQKTRKEGPCAGTKGYRAPEVLLKSVFQTEKIDIWSAGVSLFQLLLGKSPFPSSSSLEQSLLNIAQFGGSDAICTLAKEHHREASLSKEWNSTKVQPTSVHLWCERNTKRSDVLPLVPPSLFNLLEKCLQIDPRKRISAKEALQHEFFSSCHESTT